MEEGLVRTGEALKITGLKRRVFFRLVKEGEIPSARLGYQHQFDPVALAKWRKEVMQQKVK